MRWTAGPGARCGVPGLLLLALLVGCGDPHRIPPEAEVMDVPPKQQAGEHDCGIAAVDSLTAYHGRALLAEDREALRREAEAEEGVAAAAIRDALRRAGYQAFLVHGDLGTGPQGLAGNLSAQRPVLVYLNNSRITHAMLIIGRIVDDEEWIVLDPIDGKPRRVDEDTLVDYWDRTERLAIVAALPATADHP